MLSTSPTSRHLAAATILALSALAASGQTPAPPQLPAPQAPAAQVAPQVAVNRTTILLDPSHGGVDSGSRIGDSTLEKDVTLALAFRLRSLLTARGFTVTLTRDADNTTEPNAAASPLTLDDRAGIANHSHAVACLLLHATARGKGVHLYASELTATPGVTTPEPWLTAQAPWVPASQQLESRLSQALSRAGIANLSSAASVRPVDSLACPALVVELAPENDDPDSISDADYQQRVSLALAGALLFWQTNAQPPIKLLPAPTPTPAATTTGQQP
jgi:N-acetylmuramoyl-L-alanine amidase